MARHRSLALTPLLQPKVYLRLKETIIFIQTPSRLQLSSKGSPSTPSLSWRSWRGQGSQRAQQPVNDSLQALTRLAVQISIPRMADCELALKCHLSCQSTVIYPNRFRQKVRHFKRLRWMQVDHYSGSGACCADKKKYLTNIQFRCRGGPPQLDL